MMHLYNYELSYEPVKFLVVADALSRAVPHTLQTSGLDVKAEVVSQCAYGDGANSY